MSAFLRALTSDKNNEQDLGGQMSFLEHLDELRKRLIRSFIFIIVAGTVSWFFAEQIYAFLSAPVEKALAEAQQHQVPIVGHVGNETIQALASLKENDTGRYVFAEETKLGSSLIPAGASVMARVLKDTQGHLALFTDEALYAGNTVISKGVRLPTELSAKASTSTGINDKLIVTTAIEPFSLWVKVSLYAAIGVSIPFLLWQIWAFVSPGLYPHERAYVTPFIALSSISFVLGAAFAYYIIFPPAAKYLLGLGSSFRLLLKASDYFDFIVVVMLGMGVVFQMPAITYVLARIGLVTARFMVKIWKTALIVILAAAALLSPTSDIPNMLLFAAPMLVLYMVSIFIASGGYEPVADTLFNAKQAAEMSKDAPRRIVGLPSEVHIPLPANSPHREALEQAGLNCPVHKSLPPEINRPTKFLWEGATAASGGNPAQGRTENVRSIREVLPWRSLIETLSLPLATDTLTLWRRTVSHDASAPSSSFASAASTSSTRPTARWSRCC
jgi:sec-independent protein translocase protein TatC